MFAILKNKKGVTLLEGMIAILLLSVVTLGTFGVVLSSSRKVSQPDIREEMILAVEQAHHFLQGASPTMPIDGFTELYRDILWDGEDASVRLGTVDRPGIEEPFAVKLQDDARWRELLMRGEDKCSEDGCRAFNTGEMDSQFLPSLCNPEESSIRVEVTEQTLDWPYADAGMRDPEISGLYGGNLPVKRSAFTITCKGYGV